MAYQTLEAGLATYAGAVDETESSFHAPVDEPQAVVGGAPVEDGTWPDVAALYTLGDQFACSGVLIAPDLVLTAGHCGYGIGKVVVGTADYANGGHTVPVIENLVHEDYLVTIDAAVLRLAQPVTDVTPRMLARDCVIEDDLYSGAPVAIVGFGATDAFATEWTTVLHEADTTVDDPDCADLERGCNEAVSPGGELTAGGDGVDSCSGDSGGPLYLLAGDGPDEAYLVGITSRAAKPAQTVCGDGGIYVRADAIAAWIEDDLGLELPRPECDGNQPPQPSADPIVVVADESSSVRVLPNDPDDGQGFSFAILAPPAHGAATVKADGTLSYDATGAPLGYDNVQVMVTDDGYPPRSGLLDVPIHVVPVAPGTGLGSGSGCGCASGSPGGSFALWTAFAALRRRKVGRG